MISETDIWRAALAMVKRYRDEAMLEASMRADQLLEDGDWRGAVTWHRILDAIERLQAKARRRPRALSVVPTENSIRHRRRANRC